MTRDFRGPSSQRQASRRREPTFERQAPSARRILGLAALVLVIVASGAFIVGAVVNGAQQPTIPDLAGAASPSDSPGALGVGGPGSSSVPGASNGPAAQPSPEVLPPGEVAWVPVVGFWSTTNTISEQALSAALGGGSVRYKDVIVPTDDVAAIEDALGVTVAGSVKRGTPDEVKAAVKKGCLLTPTPTSCWSTSTTTTRSSRCSTRSPPTCSRRPRSDTRCATSSTTSRTSPSTRRR